jgi:hypothetical protein
MATLEPLHRATDPARPHVIFFHGLGGHPRTTWVPDGYREQKFWLHWLGEATDCSVWTAGYGRRNERGTVRAFLENTAPDAHRHLQVTGLGGIGKTEVCKAALVDWLSSRPGEVAFYVEVPDTANAAEFLVQLGNAVGVENPTSFAELRPRLVAGLYYIDNVESLAEDPLGQGRRGHGCRPCGPDAPRQLAHQPALDQSCT